VLRSASKVATKGLWPLLLGNKGSKPSIVRAASWSARWSRSSGKKKVAALKLQRPLLLAPFYFHNFAKFHHKKRRWVTHMKMQILKVGNVSLLCQIKKSLRDDSSMV
jgi:hypothetical protein